MKRIFTLIAILMALTACTVPQAKAAPGAVTKDAPQVGLANPASAYCTQQGNKHEIRTAADGSQTGICIFPDGSTCDEWAYFRGACGPAAPKNPTPQPGSGASGGYMPPGTSEPFSDWWGVIKSAPAGAQYDDYFERQDLGQIIYFGIDSLNAAVQAQIKALRDSGKVVHLYGTLFSNVPDYNNSQVQVERLEVGVQNPGGSMPPITQEKIFDWWGVIKQTPSGAQYDDYFERQDFGQVIYFGIDSMDPAVQAQIKSLRNSGKVVHLYGTLFSNMPDYNGSQIQVERIEVAETKPGSFMPPETKEKVSDWWGVIKSTKAGAQFDDCFERQDLGQIIYFGIDSMDPAIQAQIKSLRDSGKIVHLYGTLLSNVPDYNGSQIQVERIEVIG